jgi:large subunit ribosomal protein L13Ae
MFKHVIRGMLPHKIGRGRTAFNSLKAFEGIPAPYDKCKRVIVPSCYKEIKIKPNRKFASVGRLAHETGWKYQTVISTLEARRQAKAAEYYADKKAKKAVIESAKANVASKTADLDKQIAAMGY